MKTRHWADILSAFIIPALAALAIPLTAEPAAGSVTLDVYDPTGAFEVQQVFAARLDNLNGKTICELSDSAWEDNRTFPLIRSLLQEQFPTANIIPYTEFPHDMRAAGGGFAIDQDSTAAMAKQKGCQGVIVGNAG